LKTKLVFASIALSVIMVSDLLSQTIEENRLVNWNTAGLTDDYKIPNTILDFKDLGGDLSGQNSNSQLLNNLINLHSDNGAIIYFPDGEYFFDETIILKSNIHLIGNGANATFFVFDLMEEDHCIDIRGESELTSSLVDQEISFKDDYIHLSANDCIVGDQLILSPIDTHLVSSAWAQNSTGQIVKVQGLEINSLILEDEIRRSYSVEYPLEVLRLKPVENVNIENLNILRLDATDGQTSNIYFKDAYNCNVSCVNSYNCNYGHLTIHRSHHIEVKDCFFKDAHAYGGGGQGYGVVLQVATSDCLILENAFEHLRHSMLLQAGPNGNVVSYNYSIDPYWESNGSPLDAAGDIVLHGNYPYANLFEGNVIQNLVIDRSHGENGPLNTFFRNRIELYGILMSSFIPSDGQNFIGNEITNTGDNLGSYRVYGNDHFEYGNQVQENIYPSGTDTMSVATLYQNNISAYYLSQNSWPPIGLPNEIDEHNTEVQNKVISGIVLCDELSSLYNDHLPNEEFIVFPNPGRGVFNLSLENKSVAKIEVVNTSGSIVFRNDSVRENIVDLSFLSSGLYFLIVESVEGLVFRKTIVKN